MPTNLGLDDEVEALENLTGSSTGFAQQVITLFRRLAHSGANPFGAAAKSDAIATAIPAGTLLDFGGATAPTGYLLADGASVLRTAYPDLFAAIGTRFGSASATHFNLPDCRRRLTLGAGGTVPAGTNGPTAAVGATGGNEEIILSEAQLPAHHHAVEDINPRLLIDNQLQYSRDGESTVRYGVGLALTGANQVDFDSNTDKRPSSIRRQTGYSSTNRTQSYSGGFVNIEDFDTENTGTGADVGIMPPVIVVTKIIKT